MKRLFTTTTLLAAAVAGALACTNFIVGKKASKDGSVICSYSADSYGMFQGLVHYPAAKHQKGEMLKVYEWDTNRYLGEIAQAEQTWNVIGNINEWQLTIGETTFGGREEMVDTTGIIDYGSLIYITLQRAKNAREAIDVMTTLVEQYGYCSEGETFTICDPNEAWIMEMMGTASDRKIEKGRTVWVALRIPDDMICGHANQSRITRFDMKDKTGNVRYSKNVVSYARKMGWFSGKDEDFSYNAAYAAPDFSGRRICDARVWSFFNRFIDGMDKYLPYVNGEDYTMEMPLYTQPKQKVTLRALMQAMRDHYENTPLDIRYGLGAGAYNMPYRPSPLSTKIDGKEYYNERPISTQQTGFSIVAQMRSNLPDAVGGVAWWTNDDPNMAAYTPVYCSVNEVPECYVRIPDVQDEITFSWKSAYWLSNTVANMVYPYYSKMFPDLEEARNELEFDYYDNQAGIEAKAMEMLKENPTKAKEFLTDYSQKSADKMMERWMQLFKFMVVKHNDMVLKPVENGKFKRSEYGYGATVKRPGYSEDYWKKIINESGDQYLMKEKK